MKEKRQKRDDEHARSFSLPTGGVDVSQLTALGLPCPPPYNVTSTNFGQLPGMTHVPPQYPVTSSPGHFPPVLPYSPASFQMSPSFIPGQSFRVPYPYVNYSPSMASPKLQQLPRVPEKSSVWYKLKLYLFVNNDDVYVICMSQHSSVSCAKFVNKLIYIAKQKCVSLVSDLQAQKIYHLGKMWKIL